MIGTFERIRPGWQPIASAPSWPDNPGIVDRMTERGCVGVHEVQLYMNAAEVVSEIRRGLAAGVAIESALTEPRDVVTMWRAENGKGPELVRWEGVRIASVDAGLFRALVAECRLEAGALSAVETMIARALVRLGLAPMACGIPPDNAPGLA